jgi:hypothetical protein
VLEAVFEGRLGLAVEAELEVGRFVSWFRWDAKGACRERVERVAGAEQGVVLELVFGLDRED